jgi:hypothetical protein
MNLVSFMAGSARQPSGGFDEKDGQVFQIIREVSENNTELSSLYIRGPLDLEETGSSTNWDAVGVEHRLGGAGGSGTKDCCRSCQCTDGWFR